MTPMIQQRDLLRAMFDAAVLSAQPVHCIPKFLPTPPKGRLVVVGAGKASAAMARAFEQAWDGPLEGVVVTRYGYSTPCDRIEIIESSHPVPDVNSVVASRRLLDAVSGLTSDDTVVCLISGGGSSLLCMPAEGLTLEDKQAVNKELLRSGATITEMNCVRRHLSGIKGGRLAAAAHPAKVVTLLISDVPGDSLVDIASGPTVGDPTTRLDALAIVHRYQMKLPERVIQHLQSEACESIKSDDPRLAKAEAHIVARPQMALEAAAAVAQAQGYAVHILGDSLEGEAKDMAKVMAGMTLQMVRHGQPFQRPCVLLSGGESTVTLSGNGRGGRNVEFLLSMLVELNGCKGVYGLAADTDGVDGSEDIAGAFMDPSSVARAWAQNMNPKEMLTNHDAHTFFERIGDSLITGPTMTNVNDFRAILID